MIGLKTVSCVALGLAIGGLFSTVQTRWLISDLRAEHIQMTVDRGKELAELDAKINVVDGKHDSSLEYLLDKHAVHEAEIAGLKKRLTKKPVAHEHRHLHIERYIVQTVKPLTPYDEPAAH